MLHNTCTYEYRINRLKKVGMPACASVHVCSFEIQFLYKSHRQETSDPVINFIVLFYTFHQMTFQPRTFSHLEVNADKTKYMVMSRDQNAGRTHSMKSDNSSFERVDEFKYLGTTLTL